MTARGASQDSLRSRIQIELTTFLDGRIRGLTSLAPELDELVAVLRSAPNGGKLVRPIFCYWGWRGAGGAAEDQDIVRAALALELLHASALVHDDVMDRSDRRRGAPAAHRQLESGHEARQWRGPSADFGTNAAVLVGDLLLVWSEDALYASGLAAAAVERGRAVFETLRTEVLLGQYLDLTNQAAARGSAVAAMTVVQLKSARYTIERPLHLGGALAGGDAALADVYTAYGAPLGEAFQLTDDLLGVFGDPATTGKPTGDDIREGKRTVLLAFAYERADQAARRVLDDSVGNPELAATGVERVREVMTETGARDRVQKLVAERTNTAIDAAAALDDDTRTALQGLAREMLGREH